MLIEFHAADRMYGLKAIGIYRKGIEAATSASDKVYVSTMALQAADGEAEAASSWVADKLDEMGAGETRELVMPSTSILALRTACSVYLRDLTKLGEKQADLLVPPEETNALISRLQSLVDRLDGQMEMAGVASNYDDTKATFTFGNNPPVETTLGTMKRAVEVLKGRNAKHQ